MLLVGWERCEHDPHRGHLAGFKLDREFAMKKVQTILLASAFAFAATAAFAQSLEGTARTFFTTAPGVSNFTHNMQAPASASPTAPVKVSRRHTAMK